MHHDLQAGEEIQHLQLIISIKNHREESVMKHFLEVASKCYCLFNVIHPEHFHSVEGFVGFLLCFLPPSLCLQTFDRLPCLFQILNMF